jgi:hypothetical protein
MMKQIELPKYFTATGHAVYRAKERYKIRLKPEHLDQLMGDVLTGHHIGIKLDNHGKNHVCLVRCAGKLVTICIDLTTYTIVSFLPTGLHRWDHLKKYLTPSIRRYTLRELSRYVAGNIDELKLITQPLVNTEKVQETPYVRTKAPEDLTP